MLTHWRKAVFALSLAAFPGQAQEILARLDRSAPAFKAAQAAVRTVMHTAVINEDETQTGSMTIKKDAPRKLRFLIAFTGENAFTAVLGAQTVEIYRPKIGEIEEWDIRKYRDMAQRLFLLGFGTAGSELAENYEIHDVRQETIESQLTTHLELTPKSPDVLKQLKKVELWISEKNLCPVQQKFYLPAGDYRVVTFSNLQLNPNLPGSAFDLPKSAKRIKKN